MRTAMTGSTLRNNTAVLGPLHMFSPGISNVPLRAFNVQYEDMI